MKINRKTTFEAVEYELLKSEWYKLNVETKKLHQNFIEILDVTNSEKIKQVRELLISLGRDFILKPLPQDTTWFEVELEAKDFEELLIIREYGWVNTFGNKEKVKDVAMAIMKGAEDKGAGIPHIKSIQKNIGKYAFSENNFN